MTDLSRRRTPGAACAVQHISMCGSARAPLPSSVPSDTLTAISCSPFQPTLPTTAGLEACAALGVAYEVAVSARAAAAPRASRAVPVLAVVTSSPLTVNPDTLVKLVVVRNARDEVSSPDCATWALGGHVWVVGAWQAARQGDGTACAIDGACADAWARIGCALAQRNHVPPALRALLPGPHAHLWRPWRPSCALACINSPLLTAGLVAKPDLPTPATPR